MSFLNKTSILFSFLVVTEAYFPALVMFFHKETFSAAERRDSQ